MDQPPTPPNDPKVRANADRLAALTDQQRSAVLGWLGGALLYRDVTTQDLEDGIAFAKQRFPS